MLEKQIIEEIENGSKDYFKPERIKAFSAYDTPMRESGIKASVAFNFLRDDSMEAIDLDQRNSILNIKVNIDKKNVDGLKEKYPQIYEKAVELMNTKKNSLRELQVLQFLIICKFQNG